MPYRRLPNTDTARLKAMSVAISKSMHVHPDELAFSYKTLQKAKYFISTYKQSLEHKKIGYSDKSEKGSEYHNAQRKARLYVSHFIQVVNFCIAREEFNADIREFYGLEKLGRKLPPLDTDEDIIKWGRKVIDGEDKRTMQGGTPILNPRIALVKISYDKFLMAQRNHTMLVTKNHRAVDYVNELRDEANQIILEIWNEVEDKYKDLPAAERRAKAEEYGLKYVFRKGELKEDNTQEYGE